MWFMNHLLQSTLCETRNRMTLIFHSPHEQAVVQQPANWTHTRIHWWIDQSSTLVSTPQIERNVIHERVNHLLPSFFFAGTRKRMTLIFPFHMNRVLHTNQLTGSIPSSIGRLINLQRLSVHQIERDGIHDGWTILCDPSSLQEQGKEWHSFSHFTWTGSWTPISWPDLYPLAWMDPSFTKCQYTSPKGRKRAHF